MRLFRFKGRGLIQGPVHGPREYTDKTPVNFFNVLVLIILISSWAQGAEDLKSFCRGLDKTLHKLQAETRSCHQEPKYNTSKLASYGSLKVSVLSEEEVQKLFQEMQAHTELAFNFPLNGCIERAHEMSRLMLLKGITPIKAFAYAEVGPSLQVPHPLKKGEVLSWGDHIAPVVLVEKNGTLIPYVIDPSIHSKAISSDEWFKSMTSGTTKSQAKMKYGSATTLVRTGAQIDFKNENTNRENMKELERLNELGKNPRGEDIWKEEDERVRWKIEPPGY